MPDIIYTSAAHWLMSRGEKLEELLLHEAHVDLYDVHCERESVEISRESESAHRRLFGRFK